jgi:hypothetical protein
MRRTPSPTPTPAPPPEAARSPDIAFVSCAVSASRMCNRGEGTVKLLPSDCGRACPLQRPLSMSLKPERRWGTLRVPPVVLKTPARRLWRGACAGPRG